MVRRMLKDDSPTSSTSFKGSGQGYPYCAQLSHPPTRRPVLRSRLAPLASTQACSPKDHRWKYSAVPSVPLLHHNAAASMNVLPRQPPGLLADDERDHIGDVFRRTKPLQGRHLYP